MPIGQSLARFLGLTSTILPAVPHLRESRKLPPAIEPRVTLSDPEVVAGAVTTPSPGLAAVVLKNIGANLARAAAVSVVAILLPSYLTQHLPVKVYAAWVLIVQLGAYVSYFDLGIQIGISKFVAEYHAKRQLAEAGRYASAGLALMVFAGLLGAVLILGLSWQIPRLFSAMPPTLLPEVRISLVLVGFSLCVGLVSSVYSAVFLGLQRYWIPTLVTILNRALFAVAVFLAVLAGGSLTVMGLVAALVNIFTGILQIVLWRRYASRVSVSLKRLDVDILKNVTRYCSLQSVSTLAMFCITGLDIVIVGHFDYVQTAYYSLATLPTSFLLLIIASLLSPLMPASSALSTRVSPSQMGAVLERITRYNTIALLLTGLPLVVFAFPILRLWVGGDYASHTISYLRILVIANLVRNLCAPYATMITATANQKSVIAAAVSEAVVNLGSSIYLASRFGAIGVALGTLMGACVSILIHFVVSIRLTRPVISISRSRLLLHGILAPCLLALPSLLLIAQRWPATSLHVISTASLVWLLCTLTPAYHYLNRDDRERLSRLLFHWRRRYSATLFSSCF